MASDRLHPLSRRSLLGAAAVAAAAPAWGYSRGGEAASPFKFPARIGYLRFGSEGYQSASPIDRSAWNGFAVRMGALIEDVRPLGMAAFNFADAPSVMEDGASAALAARAAASEQGVDYALVYTVETVGPGDDSEPDPETSGRFRRVRGLFQSVAERAVPIETTMGEAHLLSIDGGSAIASVWVHPPSVKGGVFAKRRSTRETEALERLTELMEHRIRDFASQLYRRNRSIAD